MPWTIELFHPYTNANETPNDLALYEAELRRSYSAGGVEASISLHTAGVDLLRKMLKFRLDGSARYYGVVTKAPDANLLDEIKTITVPSAKKRLYETLMPINFVKGADVGTMVNSVLNLPGVLPSGFTWAGSPTFGFALGDRVTRKSESIGDFLDAMAQALPAFTVPVSPDAEFIATYPEYSNYNAGDFVPAAIWDVNASGVVFFDRVNTSQTLTENVNCIIYEQDDIASEELITAVRWLMAYSSFSGHGVRGKQLTSLPADPTAEPVGGRTAFSFQDFSTRYETINFDVISDEAQKYGISMAAFEFGDVDTPSLTAEAVERHEPDASNVNVGIVYGSTNDSFFNLTLLSDSTDVNLVSNTFSNTFTFYRDITNIDDVVGFQAEFGGFPFAWTLHNSSESNTYPVPEVDKVVSEAKDGVIFFSKSDIELQKVNPNDTFRLSVTLAIDPSKINSSTAEPSVNVGGCWLVKINETYLTRLAQSLMKIPSSQNKLIVCFDFVNPTREVTINLAQGGTETYVASSYVDMFKHDEWGTIITVGQAEDADTELLNDLLRDLSKQKLKL